MVTWHVLLDAVILRILLCAMQSGLLGDSGAC